MSARSLLAETSLDHPPQDAFRLASACGLTLVPAPGNRGALDFVTMRLTYPARTRRVHQHGVIAHELGHFALDHYGEVQSEDGADWVGAALMLPAAGFDADLKASAWDFQALRAKHPNCSASMIARRIVQRREAVATVVDQGRVTLRVSSPWLEDPRLRRLSAWERLLVDEALAENLTVHGDDLCYAVPVLDGRHRRVIVVCEAEQLSLRL
jgi:hypothetical protein